ncbi:hypothetical protein [Aliiroseovarius sediminis]|uniref:hypothetical protein n=1 Tax=Aliiroseovarius sediminis TaxID=2925839 RepID=UPI001F596391|nr:hypothetical protein [Aliiroseovarius sediminis]MCI2395605.1 hypothetical protein [Aliiroseovarius sediminis]
MAHHKRKRPRVAYGRGYSTKGLARRLGVDPREIRWWESCPRWHNLLANKRPQRRRTKSVERATLTADDPDTLVWPVDGKPHDYFW